MALDKPLSTVNNPRLPDIQRKDAWWAEPLTVAIVFIAFTIYVTFRAFENRYPEAGTLLSPLYSPYISTHWIVLGKHVSPAIFVLPFPLLFRGTCYYYRKAYYRAFFADPSACAVREPFARKNYTGEREFPLIIQNIHRYAFYFAAIIVVILWWDTILAFTQFKGGARVPGATVGSFVFLANIVLLSLYTFSCHSWRHLTGGCLNCFSCSAGAIVRHSWWQKISHFNENHARWAWLSLFSVALADIYVRCVASGAITDFRFF